jgi:hypothetical protein
MKPVNATKIYALAFGLFLGLAIWKFGNPVILDHNIRTPASPADFWTDVWPTHWANWILLLLAVIGALPAFVKNQRPFRTKWLWLLPLGWLGWQFISAAQSQDSSLTSVTLWQFFGCVACYFIGAFLLNNRTALNLLLIGILAAFAFCLIRAVNQKLFEFPQGRQWLVAGERANWTNLPPELLVEMKRDRAIITTNGLDMANPMLLAKFAQGRVNGTLVYPNALAGIIVLLLPLSLVLAFGATRQLKPPVRAAAIGLTIFLGGAAFFWTGSKLGWLIAMGIGGLYLFRLDWPAKLKLTALALVMVLGLGIFAVRFHGYFAAGATSVGARFDYWRAAVQTTVAHPLVGTGPGTFQRPYAQLKSPDAEMARLAHNDYLEQFSDSGLPGGLAYAGWIALAMAAIGKKLWRAGDPLRFAVFAGLTGWFAQGFGEFGLYVPALAWTAFTLLGCLMIEFDKKSNPI